MITKKEVLSAINLIESYKIQELIQIKSLAVESDKRNISILGLGTREEKCLYSYEINTIGELLNLNRRELIRFRNLGKKGVESINKSLKGIGILTTDFSTKN